MTRPDDFCDTRLWKAGMTAIGAGGAVLAISILIGLWQHNLWPSLWIAASTGAILWLLFGANRIYDHRRAR